MGNLTVMFHNGKSKAYKGIFDASLAPSGALIIIQTVPNITDPSSEPLKIVRDMYNSDRWDRVKVE